MQNATVKQINSVIESYLTSQTMFTAYDVTKGVRSQGLHVMHADVKEALTFSTEQEAERRSKELMRFGVKVVTI